MSLVAHYAFNNNSKSLVNNLNGSDTNVTYTAGKLGNAATFTGNGVITVANNPKLQIIGDLTISMWLKPNNLSARRNPINKAYGGEYTMTQETDGSINFYWGTAGANTSPYQGFGSGAILTSGQWTHICLVRNLKEGTLKWYANGIQVAGATATYDYATASNFNVLIGNGYTNGYDGQIDDLRMYDHALSEREVKDLSRGIVASYSFDREAQYTENVVNNTNLDTGWSKGYTTNVIFDEIAPPPGVDSPTVGFEDIDANGTCYWYSYGDYAPQEPGKLYAASVWMKVQGGNVGIRMYTANNSEVGRYNSEYIYVSDSDGWKRVEWDVFRNASDSQSDSMSFRFVSFTTERVWLCAPQLELNHHTPFVDGIREDSISDNSGNWPKAVLDNNCPQWISGDNVSFGAYKFNGENTHIVTNTQFDKEDFTYAAWVNVSSSVGTWNDIIDTYAGDSVEWTRLSLLNGAIHFYLDNNNVAATITGPVLSTNQWYHVAGVRRGGTAYLFVNGVVVGTTSANIGVIEGRAPETIGAQYNSKSENFNGMITGVKIYATGLSDEAIKEEYQTGLAVDDHHRMHSAYLNESGIINPNLLDYTTWTVGTTGSESGFGRNGSDAENHRVADNDPFGKQVTVWEARPYATSGADGGWNGSFYSVDNTKFHRFSVWIRRTVIGNGSYYFGTNGGGAAVLNRSNGASNTNPYFASGGWGGAAGQWRLFVAYVWPAGSGTGSNRPESGIYENGVKIGSIGDFVCASGTTSLRHRSYLYYSTDTTTRQQFVYPRIDVCDGSEPSIEALIAGFDSLNYERTHDELGSTAVPDNLGVKRGHTDVGLFSEVGISRGLVSWFPLKGDAKDRVSNEVATVNGAVPTADGYEFDGVDDKIDAIAPEGLGSKDEITLSITCFSRSNGWHRLLIVGEHNHAQIDISSSGILRFYTSPTVAYADSYQVYDTQSRLNEWVHVCGVVTSTHSILYINGEEVGRTAIIGLSDLTNPLVSIGGDTRNTANYYNGFLRNAKIFDKALTPEEVAQEYESSSKAMINKSTAFAKEFIEV